ncbi:LysR family transcriptional regulator [Paracoccus sediminicola]|uniref:LysR family transcriptional regulator n=1 Tax=Paracoccus sediminicola TaxID=3017783 RepID=UPI0022F02BF0|nr:LysR family transcriptional regulator [Paracoccus sediminicola]WBU56292.1 LysR family transcriptional regulator [Paracoccus sediminicola]
MARPNIRQIEAFNAVMKGGSISKAAETLFVSQPAVSKMIRAFEDACGFKLFVRASSRIRPTAEARRLFMETEKLQAGVARVENTAKAIRGLERGDLAVVAFPALSFRVLPRAAAQFMRAHKNIYLFNIKQSFESE